MNAFSFLCSIQKFHIVNPRCPVYIYFRKILTLITVDDGCIPHPLWQVGRDQENFLVLSMNLHKYIRTYIHISMYNNSEKESEEFVMVYHLYNSE